MAANSERRMTIGEVARAAAMGVETVRYYERRGLIDSPPRTRSGYRAYSPAAVARLRFIGQAKTLGFSLAEIGELLALRVAPDASCADVRHRARAKLRDMDRRIAELEAMRRALERLVERCSGNGPTSDCPIVEALEEVTS